MITHVKGDLFAANERAIAHGCNCHGVMGAGVAKIVREKYHTAFLYYRQAVSQGWFYPGVAQPCRVDHDNGEVTTVYNLATQNAPGANAKYHFVEQAMRNMKEHMFFVGNKRIAMPKIGAGIGGLDWNRVETIIDGVFARDTFDVVVYSL